MGMTLAEKILAHGAGRERVKPDEIVIARVDLAMSHENADLVRKSFLEIGVSRVWDPSKIVIIFDHRIPAESEKTAATHKAVREFVADQAIESFYDVGRGGICHQVLPENGHVRPGMILVGTDSHTTTHGAFGAFATGIGATEMAGVWAEGSLWFKVPSTLRIEVTGEFRQWISAKDLILYIIGKLGAAGADYRAVEFDGPAIRRMTVASRMVLANLSMEMGAKVAFTPVDEVLLDYLRPRVSGRLKMIGPDADAQYERVIYVDAGDGYSRAADRLSARRGLGAAAFRAGRGAGPSGRARILHQREAGGPGGGGGGGGRAHGASAHAADRDSGIAADLSRGHAAGLSGDAGGRRGDHQPAGMRAVRRRPPGHPGGRRSMRLLDQPEFPGQDGQQGFACVPGEPGGGGGVRHRGPTGAPGDRRKGGRVCLSGRLTLRGLVAAVLRDNVDTDMIYPGRYLNITDREKTAEHLFELAFPDLRERVQAGGLIVAGRNFGCGSSREQAAAALKFAGAGAVIAPSFARIFLPQRDQPGPAGDCLRRDCRSAGRATNWKSTW